MEVSDGGQNAQVFFSRQHFSNKWRMHLNAQALSHTRKYPSLTMFGMPYYHTQPHRKMSSDLFTKLPKLTYTYNVLKFPAKMNTSGCETPSISLSHKL